MAQPVIVVDAITRWLEETIENLSYLEREGLNDFLEVTLTDTFDVVKKRALHIINTGEPQGRIYQNVGRYAIRKAQGLPLWSFHRGTPIIGYTPTNHPLGQLTGDLYRGVKNTPIGPTRRTRGREVRIDTKFSEPTYIQDVHDGLGTGRPRKFLDIAAEDVEIILAQNVEAYLATLDVVVPHPQFISTIISNSPMRGVVVY